MRRGLDFGLEEDAYDPACIDDIVGDHSVLILLAWVLWLGTGLFVLHRTFQAHYYETASIWLRH